MLRVFRADLLASLGRPTLWAGFWKPKRSDNADLRSEMVGEMAALAMPESSSDVLPLDRLDLMVERDDIEIVGDGDVAPVAPVHTAVGCLGTSVLICSRAVASCVTGTLTRTVG